MEKLPSQKKESGVSRVVGFESGHESELLDYFKNRFESNFPDQGIEKEKTPEEENMIVRMNDAMQEFLNRYAVEAIEIPSNNIHILDQAKISPEELLDIQKRFGTENGFYSARKQGVAILKEYKEGKKLSFLQTLAHEMLHLEGFYSYQKSSPEAADFSLRKGLAHVNVNIRRSGFSIGTRNGERLLFNNLDEAVITELAIRFERVYFDQWPELEAELRARDEYVRHVAERDRVPAEKMREEVARLKGDASSGYEGVRYSYPEARAKFNSLVDKLYEKNKSEYTSREQIFDLFVKATMTGKLLPVARLIEKTFGKGSFRMIGERSADKPNSDVSI